jgi:outer membrane protein OmpA-like peptidoglycan-associated protein
VGWGIELLPGFSGGIDLKADQSDYPGKTYYAYSTDLGFLFALSKYLDLGMTYSNIKLGSNIGDLVSGWRLGAAWTVDKHLLLAASGELQNSAMDRLQVGAEYLVGNTDKKANILALRAGYQANYPNPQLTGLDGLTLGLGYTFSRSMTIDYAMVPTGDLGTSHRFSLTYKFDCPQKKKPQVAAAPAPEPAAAPVEQAPVVEAPVVEPPPIVLKSVLLEDSHFDYDKATLRPAGMAALRENVQLLKDNPKSIVRVAGYTSMSGTEEYNQKLSERRAESVETFLVSEGIAPGRISTIGYGETRPAEYEATPNRINTSAAHANMRVLFTVTVK